MNYGWGVIAILLWGSVANASRLATVEGEGADVYENPNITSKVLEKLPPKTEIAASNFPTEGFHKVRTPTGALGWVEVKFLVLQPLSAEVLASMPSAPATETKSPVEPKEEPKAESKVESPQEPKVETQSLPEPPSPARSHFHLRLLGGLNFYKATGIIANTPGIGPGYSFGGELAFMIFSRLGLIFRTEYIFQSVSLTDSNTKKNFILKLDSIPIMGGFDLILVKGPRVSIHLGTFVGTSYQTKVKATDLSGTAPPDDVAEVVTKSLAALGKIDFNWQVSKVFSLFLEGGYRILVTPSVSPPSTAAAAILQSEFSVNQSGPIAGAGVGFSF